MATLLKFTEDFRRRELLRGKRSLFYFGVSILGFGAPDPDTGKPQIGPLHRDLAHFLEGRPPHHPWRRAMVCMFRGAGKSVWTTQTYPLWRGLYTPNFSTKIIENSSDNAKRHHFLPIVDLLTTSPRADYLQWLYEHRIVPGWTGTTSEQLKFVQTDPLANPTLSYWGLDSKYEGAHPDLVVLDDPEGADAQKSLASNAEAWNTYQTVIPLLKHPLRSQILVTLTPHGEDPMAWRVRDKYNWRGMGDNARADCEFKVYWQPVLREDGESAWEERFPLEYINALSREDIFPQQYMLRRSTSRVSLFNMNVVLGEAQTNNTGSCYSLIPGRRAIAYPGYDYDPGEIAEPGYLPPAPDTRIAMLPELRNYLHFDPLHRTLATRRSALSKQRPADAAIAAVGITDDYHAIVLEGWSKNTDIDEQIAALYNLYIKWCPVLVTYESIGAQAWLPSLVKSMEAQFPHWRRPTSTEFMGSSIELPALSSVLVEGQKTNEAKEWVYREMLSSWVNRGRLHFHREQHEFLHQIEHALDAKSAVDLVDCLAQGPEVWAPPVAANKLHRKFNEYVKKANDRLSAAGAQIAPWARRTGYRNPWGR